MKDPKKHNPCFRLMKQTTYRGERALEFSSGELYSTAGTAGNRWFSDEQYFSVYQWNKLFATVYRSANIMPEALALAWFRSII